MTAGKDTLTKMYFPSTFKAEERIYTFSREREREKHTFSTGHVAFGEEREMNLFIAVEIFQS